MRKDAALPKAKRKPLKSRQSVVERPADATPPADRVPGRSREYLRLLFANAAELMGTEDEPQIRDFTVKVFQLSELLRAFRRSPGGKIGGQHGVAAQMDLSRNAIYVWLDSLQLDPADLRAAADLTELLHKSPVLRQRWRDCCPRN